MKYDIEDIAEVLNQPQLVMQKSFIMDKRKVLLKINSELTFNSINIMPEVNAPMIPFRIGNRCQVKLQ